MPSDLVGMSTLYHERWSHNEHQLDIDLQPLGQRFRSDTR